MEVGDEVEGGQTSLPMWESGDESYISSLMTFNRQGHGQETSIGLGAEDIDILDSEQIIELDGGSNENELFGLGGVYPEESLFTHDQVTGGTELTSPPTPYIHHSHSRKNDYSDLIKFPDSTLPHALQPYCRSVDSPIGQDHDDLESVTTASLSNIYGDISADESSDETTAQKFIWDDSNRKRRFINSILGIFAEVNEIESQTAAVVQLKACYESREYTLEDTEELEKYKKNAGIGVEISFPTSEELEDDHHYAATILTQNNSSTSVHDHLYNEAITSCSGGSKRTQNAWFQKHGSNAHASTDLVDSQDQTRKSADLFKSYIKLKFEREKRLRHLLTSIFTKVVKLEAETEAVIQITITYERHIFNKENYRNVQEMLKPKTKRVFKGKVRVVNTSVVENPVPAPGTLRIRFLKDKPQSILSLVAPAASSSGFYPGSSNSNPNSPSPSLGLEVYTTTPKPIPRCSKCSQHFPPGNCEDSSQICWVRCADPLCQYLVHSSCIGFHVHRPADIRCLPKFYCEQHRNC